MVLSHKLYLLQMVGVGGSPLGHGGPEIWLKNKKQKTNKLEDNVHF